MIAIRIALLSSLFLSAGCVQSLHEVYTQEQLFFEPSLAGTWTNGEAKPTLLLVSGNEAEKVYQIYIVNEDKKKSGPYDAHIARVGEHYLVDLVAARPTIDPPAEFEAALGMAVPTHVIMLADITPPVVKLRAIDYSWMKKFVGENPSAIKFERVDSDILLTASTADLQAFFLKHRTTEGAFGKPGEFRKISPSTQPTP